MSDHNEDDAHNDLRRIAIATIFQVTDHVGQNDLCLPCAMSALAIETLGIIMRNEVFFNADIGDDMDMQQARIQEILQGITDHAMYRACNDIVLEDVDGPEEQAPPTMH